MATPETVTELPRPLPATVGIDRGMTLTPNEMRALKVAVGRSLTEILGGEEDDLDAAPDRIQALVWIQLRRDGHAPSWDQAGDVAPVYREAEVDPTSGGRS